MTRPALIACLLSVSALAAPHISGKTLVGGHVDAGTLPTPILGGMVYDVGASKILISDGGTWTYLATSLPAAPLFSFASSTAYNGYPAYAGLPATDGCKSAASVTGAKGELLTFTRATASSCCTSADCSTLEQCTSGQVCISPYSGGRGMRVSRGYTENVIRTEEFDNAAWLSFSAGGASNPVVTTDYAAAPDGTASAERIQFSATSAEGSSIRYQTGVSKANPSSMSVWLKGTSGSGSVQLISYVGACTCHTCNFTTAWSRCAWENISSAGSSNVNIGNDSRTGCCGTSSHASVDVLVWGINSTDNAYAMPYVKAVSAAVTVNAEVDTFPVTVPVAATIALKATLYAPPSFTAGRSIAQVYFDANNSTRAYVTTTHASASTVTCNFRIGGADSTLASTATMAVSATNVVSCYYDGTTRYACVGGACNSSAASLTPASGAATVYVGTGQAGAGFESDGITSAACVDTAIAACGGA